MGSLFKSFTDSALSLFNRKFNELDKMMRDIDFSSAEDKFNEIEKSFKEKFTELKKRVKEFTDKFIVEVPFDKNEETISFKIENGMITITTEKSDESSSKKSTTEVSIPETVDEHHMVQRYAEDEKKMMFIFFKKKKPNKVETKEDENVEATNEDNVEQQENVNLGRVETNADGTVNESPSNETDRVSEKKRLIEKMIQMHEAGFSYRKIAEETGISDKTVKRWIKSALKDEE